MSTTTTKAPAEAELHGLLDDWAEAVRAKDVNAIVAHYAPDALAFDAIPPLQLQGKDAYRTHWEKCMTMMKGPFTFDLHDLSVTAGDDVAFCHALVWCGCENEKGEAEAGWTRATFGCRKVNGQWRIVHEHHSAPFDPETCKAQFDLKP